MSEVNSWSEFQPLEEIIIGSTFPPEFFDDVKNNNIRDCLQRIASETEEDLQNLKKTLEDLGVICHKPSTVELGFKNSILDYCSELGEAGFHKNVSKKVNPFTKDITEETIQSKTLGVVHMYDKGRNLLPTPPLNPRDDIITMGNEILFTSSVWNFHPWMVWMKEKYGDKVNLDVLNYGEFFESTHFVNCLSLQREGYIPNDVDQGSLKEIEAYIEKWYDDNPDIVNSEQFKMKFSNKVSGFCAPQVTRIGKDCIVDCSERKNITDWLKMFYPSFNYLTTVISGHNDSVFSILKPGVVMTTQHVEYHEEILPKSWTEIQAHNTIEDLIEPAKFNQIKYKNHGKWWLPGEEDNDHFEIFVNKYLSNWVGDMQETVFDVNVLMVNEETMICNNYNEELFKHFKKVNIEPIVVPNRHRFFWDAGWHCVTVDVRRTGGQEDFGFKKALRDK